jgi:hypothetical protein
MKTILTMISAGLLFVSTSCNKTYMQDVQPASENTSVAERSASLQPVPMPMPAYFNSKIYMFKTLPYQTQHNNHVAVNSLFVITAPALPGTFSRFVPIVNALPTTGFSTQALWEQVNITFNATTRPYQLSSTAEIFRLLSLPNSPIVATKTGAFYQVTMNRPIDLPAAIN